MHKRIGILGGMSPESTIEYYQYITRAYTQRFGDYGYPEIIIYSVSFQPYVDWPTNGEWDKVAAGLGTAARKLQDAGADFIVMGTHGRTGLAHVFLGSVTERTLRGSPCPVLAVQARA